jgi:two-component system NtrC family response regulator
LIVEDDPALQKQMRWAFDAYETVVADDRASAITQLRRFEPAVVTMDLGLPPRPDDPTEGFALLQEMRQLAPDTKIIVLTGQNDRANALRAIALGAYDFCTKPFDADVLGLTIERAFRLHELQHENRRLSTVAPSRPLAGILTLDPEMQRVLRTVEKVAPTSATVLVLGESGTGKELVARALHDLSPRATARFVAINCAAIPETLLESELFGYEKGAFTGAQKRKEGKFEQANNGTILLDEIGDLSVAAQAKVLRILEQKEFERVGGNESVKVDVRVIGATNKDLDRLAADNQFRKDLLFRIKVFPIYIPPLRERREDVISLAEYFLKNFAQAMGKPHPDITEPAKAYLLKQVWPGNVRELENTIERAVIHSPDGKIDVSHLVLPSLSGQEKEEVDADVVLPPEGIDLEKLERNVVRQALAAADNNQSRAAKLLGLTRGKFRVLLKNLKEEDTDED